MAEIEQVLGRLLNCICIIETEPLVAECLVVAYQLNVSNRRQQLDRLGMRFDGRIDQDAGEIGACKCAKRSKFSPMAYVETNWSPPETA